MERMPSYIKAVDDKTFKNENIIIKEYYIQTRTTLSRKVTSYVVLTNIAMKHWKLAFLE